MKWFSGLPAEMARLDPETQRLIVFLLLAWLFLRYYVKRTSKMKKLPRKALKPQHGIAIRNRSKRRK